MELLNGMIKSSGEGNISWFGNRQDKIVQLIRNIKPEYIMELGFNMGHSALLICNTIMELKESDPIYRDKIIQFYVFDICEHDTVKPNLQVLWERYKEHINFTLVEGNSLKTIPSFFQTNHIKFDFIEIDGCHTYDCVRADVTNSWNHLSPKGVMYIDDYRSSSVTIPDVDNGVDSLDWSNFDTDYIDGVFWAKKKVSNDYVSYLTKVSNLLNEEDPEILKFNIEYLKSLTNVLIKKL
jgi:hypothetical protein